jgi:NDP-sugar pyrophosphorylase family protein
VKAMIMAAGLGTRLLPLTRLISKPMVPVLNRPVMEHILTLLARHGVTQLAANLHYQPDEIPEHFGDGSSFGVSLRYQFELELSGTAGGTALFREFLSDGTFLVMSGDALTDADLISLIAHHRASGGLATIAVKRIADPSRYGVVITDADGRVTGFQEKPRPEEARSNLCSCGIYVLEPEVFRYIPSGRFVDFAQHVFPAFLADGVPFHVWDLDSYWSDIGNLDAYRGGNFDALAGRVDVTTGCAEVRPGVWVADGAQIAADVVLKPPLLLGAGCTIQKGATVVGPSTLGSQCVVGADAVVERSVLWRGCSIGSGASVNEAILGRYVLIGDGCRIGHGAVVAGGCQIASGVAVPAGARLEPGTIVRPIGGVR